MKVLDKAWVNCLRMWKWITNNLPKGFSEATEEIKDFIIDHLKEDWIEDNNYTKIISQNCFLCDYDRKHNGNCRSCPAALVHPECPFHCTDDEHNYAYEPVKFYQLIMSLNESRKGD